MQVRPSASIFANTPNRAIAVMPNLQKTKTEGKEKKHGDKTRDAHAAAPGNPCGGGLATIWTSVISLPFGPRSCGLGVLGRAPMAS